MRAKRLIPAAIVIVIVMGGLLLLNLRRSSTPVLVFIGYEGSATNAIAIANLELRNTTRKTIWLRYSGTEYPLKPPLLELPKKPLTKLTNGLETNIYSIRVGSFFMHGEKVLPGNSVRLDVPLHLGEPPKQAGVSYYFGRFSDGNDFLRNLRTPLLDSRANWKDRAVFYWQRFKKRLKAPQRHEIWCEDSLSFQAGTTNPPPK
jgi:hypothetical protein